jgi:hypothetical protein
MWLNRGVFNWFVAVGHVFCHEDMEGFLGSGFSENSDLVSHSACHDLDLRTQFESWKKSLEKTDPGDGGVFLRNDNYLRFDT